MWKRKFNMSWKSHFKIVAFLVAVTLLITAEGGMAFSENRTEADQLMEPAASLIQSFSCSTVTEIPQAECKTLVAIYDNTDGDNWTNTLENNQPWLATNTPCSDWFGVSCAQGNVTSIRLSRNRLHGTIPDMPALTSLRYLDLGHNFLYGFEPRFRDLTSLEYLDLSSNGLSGMISGLPALTNAEYIYLDRNSFSGYIPDLSALVNLKDLTLDDNTLWGQIPDLSALANLEALGLSMNYLTGPIPDLSALVNLRVLNLSGNRLEGPIPDLSALTSLRLLHLEVNEITGPIPDLSALISLDELYLSRNHLKGPIPDLSALAGLSTLRLSSNQLSGDIPLSITSTTPNGSCNRGINLRYNMLTASDPTVVDFLNFWNRDWDQVQTVPVTDLRVVSGQHLFQGRLHWAPITYTGDGGYYRISYSDVPCSQENDIHGRDLGFTDDKTVSDFAFGLPLHTSGYLFFCVQTYTPAHSINPNDLWSDYAVVQAFCNGLWCNSVGPVVGPIYWALTASSNYWAGAMAGDIVTARSRVSNQELIRAVCPMQSVGDSSTETFCSGFKSVLEEWGIEVDGLALTNDIGDNAGILSDYFVSNPDTNAILLMNPDNASALHLYFQESGTAPGEILAVAIGVSGEVLSMIEEGYIITAIIVE